MKRITIILLFIAVILSGCGRENQSVAPPDQTPNKVQKEKVPTIISADLPERDPFAVNAGEGSTVVQTDVPKEGRDPFVASADDGRQSLDGKVTTSGRDPFVEGSKTDIYPPEFPPPEPPPPVEPGKPDDPVQPPVGGGVMVAVTTLDRCWLDVFVDDTRVLRTNVPVGETLQWQGEREVNLVQIGRAWAITISVNGQDLGVVRDLLPELQKGSITRAGIRISLGQIYPGGVLVNLRFSTVN